jgi:hypothetical protein
MRFATFNLTNYNAAGQYFIGRESEPYTKKTLEDRMKEVADLLDKVAASVMGFQEVFSEVALREAVHASEAMKNAIVVAPLAITKEIDGKMYGMGPNVGLASLMPVTRVYEPIEDFPDSVHVVVPTGRHGAAGEILHLPIRKFERPLLRVELGVDGLPGLTVLVAHLKSKRPKMLPGEIDHNDTNRAMGSLRSLIIRGAEAAALRAIVADIRNERVDGRRRPLIVLGDLNDDGASVTTEMIVGKRPYSEDGTISPKFYGFNTQDLMLPAFDIIAPTPPDYTHVYDGKGSVLDMILMSADFFGLGSDRRASVSNVGVERPAAMDVPTGIFEIPAPKIPPFVDPADIDLNPPEPEDPNAQRESVLEMLADVQKERSSRPSKKPDLDHGIAYADIEILSEPLPWPED